IVGHRWRFATGFAASSVAVSAVSLWMVGPQAAAAFAKSILLVGSGSASRTGRVDIAFGTNLMPNLRGLIAGIFDGVLSFHALQIFTLACSALVFAAIVLIARAKVGGSESLNVAIASSGVVTYYFLVHDLSIVLIPIVI